MIKYRPYSMNSNPALSQKSAPWQKWCGPAAAWMSSLREHAAIATLRHTTRLINSNRPNSWRLVQTNEPESQSGERIFGEMNVNIAVWQTKQLYHKVHWSEFKLHEGDAQPPSSTSINPRWSSRTHCTESSSTNRPLIQKHPRHQTQLGGVHWGVSADDKRHSGWRGRAGGCLALSGASRNGGVPEFLKELEFLEEAFPARCWNSNGVRRREPIKQNTKAGPWGQVLGM